METDTLTLDELDTGTGGRIARLAAATADMDLKLRQVGFAESDEVELLTRGPLGGQPLAVRLNRRVIALRREEARAICVTLAP